MLISLHCNISILILFHLKTRNNNYSSCKYNILENVFLGDPTTLTDKAGEQSLPIVPNYMSNPVFPYGGSGDQVPYTNNPLPNHSEAHQNHHQSYSTATSKAGQCEEGLCFPQI